VAVHLPSDLPGAVRAKLRLSRASRVAPPHESNLHDGALVTVSSLSGSGDLLYEVLVQMRFLRSLGVGHAKGC
jgi:hypothetical protein